MKLAVIWTTQRYPRIDAPLGTCRELKLAWVDEFKSPSSFVNVFARFLGAPTCLDTIDSSTRTGSAHSQLSG